MCPKYFIPKFFEVDVLKYMRENVINNNNGLGEVSGRVGFVLVPLHLLPQDDLDTSHAFDIWQSMVEPCYFEVPRERENSSK